MMARLGEQTKKNGAQTNGVLDYLRTAIPRSNLLDLYTDETRGRFVCRAILQQLSDVGQQIVMRLACCGGSFPLGGQAGVQGVRDWVAQNQSYHNFSKN